MALGLACRSKIIAPYSDDARIIQYRPIECCAAAQQQHAAFYTAALVYTEALLALESLALLVYALAACASQGHTSGLGDLALVVSMVHSWHLCVNFQLFSFRNTSMISPLIGFQGAPGAALNGP
jgi:hypothetical protein